MGPSTTQNTRTITFSFGDHPPQQGRGPIFRYLGWADVESDDEEEHFPGFGDLNSTNATTGKQQETETETNPFLGRFD